MEVSMGLDSHKNFAVHLLTNILLSMEKAVDF